MFGLPLSSFVSFCGDGGAFSQSRDRKSYILPGPILGTCHAVFASRLQAKKDPELIGAWQLPSLEKVRFLLAIPQAPYQPRRY
jgi:hypothetical protein